MWPLISSARISAACCSACAGASANLTPPAFIRPPVSTCDLATTGPPTSSALARGWAAVFAKPPLEVGTPPRRTISLDSYSKKRMGGGTLPRPHRPGRLRSALRRRRREPVGLGQLGVLLRQHLGQLDHHLALLPGGVVLHLAVDHVHAATVGDRLDHLLGERDLVSPRAEDLLGDVDLDGVERPGADAPEQGGRAEPPLAGLHVLYV